jgi:hypothetical protein
MECTGFLVSGARHVDEVLEAETARERPDGVPVGVSKSVGGCAAIPGSGSAFRRRQLPGYWQGRLEFTLKFFDTVDLVNRAAIAEAAGGHEETLEDAQKALDSVRQGLTAFAHVARDQSDLGAIVMLHEYACRALAAKINALKNPPAQ